MKQFTRWFAVTALIGVVGFGGAPVRAQTETVLYNFDTNSGGGTHPYSGVIEDAQGNLYGTASGGGAYGAGVVYMLAPPYGQNSELALYSFTGGADGANPGVGNLIMDAQGNLFGTTSNGGAHGYGTVFKLTPPYGPHSETVLYSFTGGADGGYPNEIIEDAKGNFYGTTSGGGDTSDGAYLGVVFELSPPYGQTSETTLYTFTGGRDGAVPNAGVIMDKKGNLYGTTYYAGDNGSGYYFYGNGVVFELSPPYGQGSETTLYSFAGEADGAHPIAGLIIDAQGNLYGTTAHGGASGNGAVFELGPSGHFSTLYSFSGGADGAIPSYGSLIMDGKGNLYGTTINGGQSGGTPPYSYGVVFELAPPFGQSSETVLHTFTGGADGSNPYDGVIMDKKGNLLGTTYGGGAYGTGEYGGGVVFEIGSGNSTTTLASVKVAPKSVKGGSPATGTVTLTGPAPTGGAVVTLSSSNAAVASVPASVTVTSGQMTATFPITTASVSSTTKVTISATYGGVTKTAKLKVKK